MTKKAPRRPPKRPGHRPPKPDTPKIPRPRPKPFRPKPRKVSRDELTRYLAAHPDVANAIAWASAAAPAGLSYPMWSSAQRLELRKVYQQIRKGKFPGLSATPATTYFSTGMWEGTPAGVGFGVDEATAWSYFLAHTAHCLCVEIAGLVPWSLAAYSAGQLYVLLSTNTVYSYNATANSYIIGDGATPGDPVRVYQFLAANAIVSTNRRDTIARLLDWCRTNMQHATGGLVPANAQDHWQYNGYPPVERIISGTTHPQNGFSHWTFGCGGTAAFLNSVLSVVNIPCYSVGIGGHGTPYFSTERLYLSHGDDPYDRRLTTTPAVPIDELFIDRTKFTAWFDPSLPFQTQDANVGRRCMELAIQYLTEWVIRLGCDDVRRGVTNPATSAVYNDPDLGLKKFYSVADLQAQNLWTRINAKIAAGGGCAAIFAANITASITTPASGMTISGVVTVGMSVAGPGYLPYTFKVEVQGNTLFTHTTPATTDSYAWNTLNWTNGFRGLTVTVTDAVGNVSTAMAIVTIANVITAAITSPAPGVAVMGTVPVTMSVSGQTLPINMFSLKVDGNQVFNQLLPGLTATYMWNTTAAANGPHTLMLTVADNLGKTSSSSISVDVAN